MTDPDLDFSGFQTERKVDVPPPPKRKKASKKTTSKKKAASKKAESSKKKKDKDKAEAPGGPTDSPIPATTTVKQPPKPKPVARPHRKKRVNVSLPVELSRRFTEKADEEDRYLTDMVLEAYRNHYAEFLDDVEEEQGDSDLPLRPRRRKAATGRVTHMLYLAAPEIAVIDGSAEEIGLSRSELVAQLLTRELG